MIRITRIPWYSLINAIEITCIAGWNSKILTLSTCFAETSTKLGISQIIVINRKSSAKLSCIARTHIDSCLFWSAKTSTSNSSWLNPKNELMIKYLQRNRNKKEQLPQPMHMHNNSSRSNKNTSLQSTFKIYNRILNSRKTLKRWVLASLHRNKKTVDFNKKSHEWRTRVPSHCKFLLLNSKRRKPFKSLNQSATTADTRPLLNLRMWTTNNRYQASATITQITHLRTSTNQCSLMKTWHHTRNPSCSCQSLTKAKS